MPSLVVVACRISDGGRGMPQGWSTYAAICRGELQAGGKADGGPVRKHEAKCSGEREHRRKPGCLEVLEWDLQPCTVSPEWTEFNE